MSSGPSTDSQCQDTALVPTTYSKQIPEEQAGDHPLGPKHLVMQSKDPNWDADPAGEAVTSPRDSLQDPVVRSGRRGGVAISPPKLLEDSALPEMWPADPWVRR